MRCRQALYQSVTEAIPPLVYRTEPITAEMRQAGADVLQELHGTMSSEGIAERVYLAMQAARG